MCNSSVSRASERGSWSPFTFALFVLAFAALALPCWIFVRDMSAVHSEETGIPDDIRSQSSENLVSIIKSGNDAAVTYAVQVIASRNDVNILPMLVKLLNNTAPVQLPSENTETSVARRAQTALVQMFRRTVTKTPYRIDVLKPYFDTALQGTRSERKAMIEILGFVKEPLAVPLLSAISNSAPTEYSKFAASVLAKTADLERSNFVQALLLRKESCIYIAGLGLIVACGLWTCVTWLRKRVNVRLVALLLLPTALFAWLTGLAVFDFSRSIATDRRIEMALETRDLMALKSMIYSDYTDYPPDSYVVRFLERTADEDTLFCLTQLHSAGPDDDTNYLKYLRQRIAWITSRVVSRKLGSSGLEALVNSDVREVRLAVARALTRLHVKNRAVRSALRDLSNDMDAEVRKTATKGLRRIQSFPEWNWFLDERNASVFQGPSDLPRKSGSGSEL